MTIDTSTPMILKAEKYILDMSISEDGLNALNYSVASRTESFADGFHTIDIVFGNGYKIKTWSPDAQEAKETADYLYHKIRSDLEIATQQVQLDALKKIARSMAGLLGDSWPAAFEKLMQTDIFKVH